MQFAKNRANITMLVPLLKECLTPLPGAVIGGCLRVTDLVSVWSLGVGSTRVARSGHPVLQAPEFGNLGQKPPISNIFC